MALPDVGTPFTPQSSEEIRDALLADVRLETLNVTGQEAAVQPGTEDWIFMTAVANATMIQYAQISAERDGVTPLKAAGSRLDEWRESLGLPFVGASPSVGKVRVTVSVGTSTILDGTQFVFANGLRGKVVGTHTGVLDGDEVDAVSVDKGTAANADAGTSIRFVSPPLNVATQATVSNNEPFSGGTDEESDARKRARIRNRLGSKLSAGNWSQMRETVLNELASVQDCFIFPALGGPASVKVVPVRDYDLTRNEFTRAMNSGTVAIVRNAIYRDYPDQIEIVVQAASDEAVDVAVHVTIPESSQNGGSGNGWSDSVQWPILEAGDSGRVTVSSVTSSRTIVVSAVTAVEPVPGQTHIAWWSPQDRKFRQYLVTAASGATTSWTLTLDQPLVDSLGTSVAAGDYICPAAANMEAYGKSWVTIMRAIGVSENTTVAARLPRALRHPLAIDESPYSLSFITLRDLLNRHNEISNIEWGYRSLTTPTVPTGGTHVDDPPRVLVPRHFGVYKAS